MRSVREWVGRTDDSMPPPTVRLRIFRAHDGRCHLSGKKIMPGDKWHLDHIKELWEGGENRESNMAPALEDPHRDKSAAALSRKAKADAVAKKHLGIAPKKGRPIPGSKRSGWKAKVGGGGERRT